MGVHMRGADATVALRLSALVRASPSQALMAASLERRRKRKRFRIPQEEI